jgi:CHC2 zinc finger/Toprim-like
MQIDVEKTLSGLGIRGSVAGDEFLAQCPMHFERTGKEDRNPSWSINLDSGVFHCFSCGYKGTIHRLISDLKGVSVEEASTLVIKPDLSVSDLPGPNLKVKKSGISESILARFEPPPEWALEAKRLTREACQEYEVLWNPDTNSWITPIRAPYTNTLLGWQEKGQLDRYFNNYPAITLKKSSALFGLNRFKGGRMVVVESPLDAVLLRTFGVEGGVSTMGVRVSNAQLDLMSVADAVVFALDNPNVDEQGAAATKELYDRTKGKLRNVYFFDYGTSLKKDPGDMSDIDIILGLANARSRIEGFV